MLALAASSFGLPYPWRGIALSCQALWYLAALADFVLPEGIILKRLTAPIRAVTVLITAAFCALSVFVMPAQNLWKETKVTAGAPTTRSGNSR